jgi:hypothetical protein
MHGRKLYEFESVKKSIPKNTSGRCRKKNWHELIVLEGEMLGGLSAKIIIKS